MNIKIKAMKIKNMNDEKLIDRLTSRKTGVFNGDNAAKVANVNYDSYNGLVTLSAFGRTAIIENNKSVYKNKELIFTNNFTALVYSLCKIID